MRSRINRSTLVYLSDDICLVHHAFSTFLQHNYSRRPHRKTNNVITTILKHRCPGVERANARIFSRFVDNAQNHRRISGCLMSFRRGSESIGQEGPLFIRAAHGPTTDEQQGSTTSSKRKFQRRIPALPRIRVKNSMWEDLPCHHSLDVTVWNGHPWMWLGETFNANKHMQTRQAFQEPIFSVKKGPVSTCPPSPHSLSSDDYAGDDDIVCSRMVEHSDVVTSGTRRRVAARHSLRRAVLKPSCQRLHC